MPLTETQKNLLMGFGVSVVAGLTVAAIIALAQAEKIPAEHSLSIEATTGGTTEPAPSFYEYDEPTSISVTAITFEGYEFKGWYLNGDFIGDEETLTFTVDGQNLLIASFQLIDGPVLIPAYIKPIQNCRAEHWWNVFEEVPGGSNSKLLIGHTNFKIGFVKFKICDLAGNGVADQTIAVYSDPQPDATDYGYVYVKNVITSQDSPQIFTTDATGVAAIPIKYRWIEHTDKRDTLGRGGKARYVCFPIPGDHWAYPLYNEIRPGLLCWWREFVRLPPHPLYRTNNAIHAYWVDNPALAVWGDCYADCMIKLVPSKSFPE